MLRRLLIAFAVLLPLTVVSFYLLARFGLEYAAVIPLLGFAIIAAAALFARAQSSEDEEEPSEGPRDDLPQRRDMDEDGPYRF